MRNLYAGYQGSCGDGAKTGTNACQYTSVLAVSRWCVSRTATSIQAASARLSEFTADARELTWAVVLGEGEWLAYASRQLDSSVLLVYDGCRLD